MRGVGVAVNGYERAIRWLARRAYGERELAWRLQREGVDEAEVTGILDRCRELGYLNDRAFAVSRVRVRLERGWGWMRIRAELRSLGIDEEILAEAVAESGAAIVDPVARAVGILEKRFGASEGWNRADYRERRRRYAFLAQRGFESEVIDAALS
ncbi:MAG: regulatory protein RecX [Magnetococcales bacterium]|nr:regulatory protein RecX [Magnetococcales bacterium]